MENTSTDAATRRRSTLILLNVCVGQFILGLDRRALLVALPTLTHTLHASLTIQRLLLIYDPTLTESPESWGVSPGIFTQSFNHTVHVVNFFTLLSIFLSAVRGPRRD